MSCYCKCSVAFPHGAVVWSAVCDCGISDHTHLLFETVVHNHEGVIFDVF